MKASPLRAPRRCTRVQRRQRLERLCCYHAASSGGRSAAAIIKQTMTKANMWEVSTGSAVWGGGIVLNRYMEELGQSYWQGKRVLELGTGTGFGAVTAAKVRVRVLGLGSGLGFGQFGATD